MRRILIPVIGFSTLALLAQAPAPAPAPAPKPAAFEMPKPGPEMDKLKPASAHHDLTGEPPACRSMHLSGIAAED